MLGFKPLPAEIVKAVDPQLEIVNKNLEAYYNAWDKYIDAWVVIKIKDPSYVYRWRLQVCISISITNTFSCCPSFQTRFCLFWFRTGGNCHEAGWQSRDVG